MPANELSRAGQVHTAHQRAALLDMDVTCTSCCGALDPPPCCVSMVRHRSEYGKRSAACVSPQMGQRPCHNLRGI
jgi:hypothetical protein